MIQRRGRKWRVVVQAPADPLTGQRTQLSGSAATEKEAVAPNAAYKPSPASTAG